jgi:hypothetical protein
MCATPHSPQTLPCDAKPGALQFNFVGVKGAGNAAPKALPWDWHLESYGYLELVPANLHGAMVRNRLGKDAPIAATTTPATHVRFAAVPKPGHNDAAGRPAPAVAVDAAVPAAAATATDDALPADALEPARAAAVAAAVVWPASHHNDADEPFELARPPADGIDYREPRGGGLAASLSKHHTYRVTVIHTVTEELSSSDESEDEQVEGLGVAGSNNIAAGQGRGRDARRGNTHAVGRGGDVRGRTSGVATGASGGRDDAANVAIGAPGGDDDDEAEHRLESDYEEDYQHERAQIEQALAATEPAVDNERNDAGGEEGSRSAASTVIQGQRLRLTHHKDQGRSKEKSEEGMVRTPATLPEGEDSAIRGTAAATRAGSAAAPISEALARRASAGSRPEGDSQQRQSSANELQTAELGSDSTTSSGGGFSADDGPDPYSALVDFATDIDGGRSNKDVSTIEGQVLSANGGSRNKPDTSDNDSDAEEGDGTSSGTEAAAQAAAAGSDDEEGTQGDSTGDGAGSASADGAQGSGAETAAGKGLSKGGNGLRKVRARLTHDKDIGRAYENKEEGAGHAPLSPSLNEDSSFQQEDAEAILNTLPDAEAPATGARTFKSHKVQSRKLRSSWEQMSAKTGMGGDDTASADDDVGADDGGEDNDEGDADSTEHGSSEDAVTGRSEGCSRLTHDQDEGGKQGGVVDKQPAVSSGDLPVLQGDARVLSDDLARGAKLPLAAAASTTALPLLNRKLLVRSPRG